MGKPDQPRGPDGRWIPRGGGGWLLVAIALAVTLSTGDGLTAGLGSASGSSISGGAGGSSAQTGKARGGEGGSARGKARDRSPARVASRLARQGLRARQQAARADTDCAAHSYGQVREFFHQHPCTALFRALLEVRDKHGNRALLAVAVGDHEIPPV